MIEMSPYIHKLFEIDPTTKKVRRINKKCPRCGVFMARHKQPDRWSCGKCGYTEFITAKK